MEEKFLIDTNIIIYYLDGKIPKKEKEKVSKIFEHSFIISTITHIEVMGWNKFTEEDKIKTKRFLSNATVIYID